MGGAGMNLTIRSGLFGAIQRSISIDSHWSEIGGGLMMTTLRGGGGAIGPGTVITLLGIAGIGMGGASRNLTSLLETCVCGRRITTGGAGWGTTAGLYNYIFKVFF